MSLPKSVVKDAVARALAEDLGRAGDVTTAATIPVGLMAEGAIVAREEGVIAGLPLLIETFRQVDASVSVIPQVADGDRVAAGSDVARLSGHAVSILTAERTALNFLGHLSGISTATHRLVEAIEGTPARIVDTRKTTPGLRALEKYAVRCGGGSNHRFGLDDAVLIKDNHIVVAGGVSAAVKAARTHAGHTLTIEVEVDTLAQLEEALAAHADTVLLDNMAPDKLTQAVEMVAGRAVTEASGGIALSTVRAVAETGVDVISVGWITHSAPRLDVALDLTD